MRIARQFPPTHQLRAVPSLQQLHVKKLIVFRALQLGDMLCAVPALRALRAALPDARITLTGLAWARQFAQRFHPYIDDFIAFPGDPAFPEQPVQQQQLPAFYREVRARGYDLALQMHGSGEISNGVIQDFGARLAAGFVPPDTERDEAAFLAYPQGGAEPLRLQQLVGHLGAPTPGSALEFPIDDDGRNELHASRLASGVSEDGYFCVHPGARSRAKCWPLPCFAELADLLAEESGLRSALTGSSRETDLTAALAAQMRTPVVDTAGPLSIGAMAALMQGTRLLLCNDTQRHTFSWRPAQCGADEGQRSSTTSAAPEVRMMQRLLSMQSGTVRLGG